MYNGLHTPPPTPALLARVRALAAEGYHLGSILHAAHLLQHEEILRLYASGMTIKDIAAALHLSYSTVNWCLDHHGAKRPRTQADPRRITRNRNIRREAAQGDPIRAIAARHRLSPDRVRQIIREDPSP